MSKIVANVASMGAQEDISYLVDCVLDGTMNMSTNIVTLHNLYELPSLFNCSFCNICKTSKPCPIKDDLAIIFEDIRDADVLVIGTELISNKVPDTYYKFINRLLNQSEYLKLSSKKYIFAAVSDSPGSVARNIVSELEKNIDDSGMRMIDDIIFLRGSNTDIKENVALKNEANLIGSHLRNTFRSNKKSVF